MFLIAYSFYILLNKYKQMSTLRLSNKDKFVSQGKTILCKNWQDR